MASLHRSPGKIVSGKLSAWDVDRLELNRRQRVVADLRQAGGLLLKGDAAVAA